MIEKYILSCTTIESFYSVRDTIKRMKRQAKECEKICVQFISDKNLYSDYTKSSFFLIF